MKLQAQLAEWSQKLIQRARGWVILTGLVQVYKVYLRWLTGTISWWQPPEGTVFNIPLFTGWEEALVKKIPMSWWKRLTFQAVIRFNKWLYPRPRLFKWLNVGPLCAPLSPSKASCSDLRFLLQPELALYMPTSATHSQGVLPGVKRVWGVVTSAKNFPEMQEHGVPVLVYILNRPEDWDVALKLEGITAIMTDSPSALAVYLSSAASD